MRDILGAMGLGGVPEGLELVTGVTYVKIVERLIEADIPFSAEQTFPYALGGMVVNIHEDDQEGKVRELFGEPNKVLCPMRILYEARYAISDFDAFSRHEFPFVVTRGRVMEDTTIRYPCSRHGDRDSGEYPKIEH